MIVRSPKILLLSTISLFVLSGCIQLGQIRNIGKDPKMGDITIPMAKPDYEPLEWPDTSDGDGVGSEEERHYASSLWQPGSRAFFKDVKARRIGDILKVIININDSATVGSTTTQTRSSADSTKAPAALGLQKRLAHLISGSANPADLLDITSSGNASGTGSIKRAETVLTNVACMVTQILPNGNLVVHGDQEIRVNGELRQITVDGIVRTEDIAADNSVGAQQIAESRISYGGKGNVTDIQKPRLGTQLIDILSPF
jgi:flagellar L-ring protein precursor FlgH